MKTRIFKIIISLAVSLFLCAGVALAHDKKGRQHKSHGKAYGYHHDQDREWHRPNWHKKKHKSYRNRHRHHNYYHRYYYHKYWRGHHPRWKRWHYKSNHHRHKHKRHYRKRFDDWELHDRDRHGRYPDRDGFIFGMSFNDPFMSVVIGAKDH